MPRVFISHSTADRSFVEAELLPLFKEHGISTWYCRENIRTADQWERSIRDGLKETDWLVVVVSKQATASEWVHAEVSWALERRPRKVVPVLIDGSDPADLHLKLGALQHVDFREDVERARRRLLSAFEEGQDERQAGSEEVANRPLTPRRESAVPNRGEQRRQFIDSPSLGRLHLVEPLTVNCWGPKFRAKPEGMGASVAVQFVTSGDYFMDGGERLVRSILARRALRHPAIVRLFESFAWEQAICIVEEFIENASSLAAWQNGRHVDDADIDVVLEILAKVADGLHYAHLADKVHGWMSPSDILIDGSGAPHLAGFEKCPLMAQSRDMTLGTIVYSPPELVANPQHAFPGADIWALGVMLYNILYRDLPFELGGLAALRPQVPKPPVSPRGGNLDAIWMRCLDTRRADCFQSAAELAEALRSGQRKPGLLNRLLATRPFKGS